MKEMFIITSKKYELYYKKIYLIRFTLF